MFLDVFAHVEPHQFNTQLSGQHACHLCFSHARRSNKEHGSQRFPLFGKSGLSRLYGLRNQFHSLVLTVNQSFHALFQRKQRLVAIVFQGNGLHLAHLRKHIGHQSLIHFLPFCGQRVHLAVGPGLVNQVDSLVGQEPIVNILGTGMHGKLDNFGRIMHVVELLILPFQSVKYLDCLFGRRFGYVYLLETAHNTGTLGKISVVFGIGGAADKAHISPFQIGFEHVRCVH